MRSLFRYDYTTENFVRYVSVRPDGKGKYAVVYVPITMLPQDWKSTTLQDFILTNSPNPARAVREFEAGYQPAVCDLHSVCMPMEGPTQNIRLLADRVEVLTRERHLRVQAEGNLSHRIAKLEIRQGILFQAVEKIIFWMRRVGYRPSR